MNASSYQDTLTLISESLQTQDIVSPALQGWKTSRARIVTYFISSAADIPVERLTVSKRMCPSTDLKALGAVNHSSNTSDDAPSCVPADDLSTAAYAYAKKNLHPLILNHSLRVFLYMTALSEQDDTHWHQGDNLSLLFSSAMFHDFGTTDICNGPERFEIEGADAAVEFLRSHGIKSDVAKEVWVAVVGTLTSRHIRTCSLLVEGVFKKFDGADGVSEVLTFSAQHYRHVIHQQASESEFQHLASYNV